LVALWFNERKVLTASSKYIRLTAVSVLASRHVLKILFCYLPGLAVVVEACTALRFFSEAFLDTLSVAKSVNSGRVFLALAVHVFRAVSLFTSLSAGFSSTAVGRVTENLSESLHSSLQKRAFSSHLLDVVLITASNSAFSNECNE
jgi:hypothetical protein